MVKRKKRNNTTKNKIILLIILILPMPKKLRSRFGFGRDDDTTCLICAEDFEPDDVISAPFRCDHRFHEDCVSTWISTKRRNRQTPFCPTCRSELPPQLNPVVEDDDTRAPPVAWSDDEDERFAPPPERPEIMRINPGLFGTDTGRRRLNETLTQWRDYRDAFINYNINTRRQRNATQIQRDENEIIFAEGIIGGIVRDLNRGGINESPNSTNTLRRGRESTGNEGTPPTRRRLFEFGKKRSIKSKISINTIRNAIKYLKTL
jgi:hypothetical protein